MIKAKWHESDSPITKDIDVALENLLKRLDTHYLKALVHFQVPAHEMGDRVQLKNYPEKDELVIDGEVAVTVDRKEFPWKVFHNYLKKEDEQHD